MHEPPAGHDGRRTFDRTYNILLNRHLHRFRHLWRDIGPGDIEAFFKFPPDVDAADIVYQILSHVGAFPFCRYGPVPLRKDELMIAVSMMTDHYQTVLGVPEGVQESKLNWEPWDRLELVFDSLSVEVSATEQEAGGGQGVGRSVDGNSESEFHSGSGSTLTQSSGSSRPHVAMPRRRLNLGTGEPRSNAEPIDCDLLVIAAYDSLCIKTYPKHPESHDHIPIHKLRRFLHLMLITRVTWPSEGLWPHVEEDEHGVGKVVDSMVRTFLKATTISRSPGVMLEHLYRIVPVYFPHIFEGLMRLFGEFLSEKHLTYPWLRSPARGPLLEDHWKDGSLGQTIMCDGVIMQLGMFLPRSQFLCGPALVFHSLPGEEVNMAEFDSRTNGLKRTVLLLKGTTVPNKRWEGGKTTWHDSLADMTRSGSTPETRTYGVYLPEPWQTTGEFSYGGQHMVLFRLEPTHEVFPIAGTKGRDYMWFPEPREKRRSMMTFGSPPRHRRWQRPAWPWPTLRDLGGISLMVEGGMGNAVFLHNRQQPHTFRPSVLDEDAVVNEVLAVERVEVWRFR